jgi:hypothetical protein
MPRRELSPLTLSTHGVMSLRHDYVTNSVKIFFAISTVTRADLGRFLHKGVEFNYIRLK